MADLVTIFFGGPFYLLYFIVGPGFYNVPIPEVFASVFGTAIWMVFLAVMGKLLSG